MTPDELFRAFLRSYAVYYDVREAPEKNSPFDAEAIFASCEEQYFLLKGFSLSETRIAEYVYFAKRERLTKDELERLDKMAWERGLEASSPGPGHKCSDVTLIILADAAADDAKAMVGKCRRSKTYRFGLHGFSHYRLAVIECSTGAFFFNGQGTHLRPLVQEIWKAAEKTNSASKS